MDTTISFPAADLNKDGRADVVCVADDGSMMVWESRSDIENIFDPNAKWIDGEFGFCEHQEKQVIFHNCRILFFKRFLEDIGPLCGTTYMPVLDF